MPTKTKRNKTYSTRASKELGDQAKAYLAKYGITISEYMRYSLAKAANHEVEFIKFLDSPEAKAAKREAEQGEGKTFDSLKALWKELNE